MQAGSSNKDKKILQVSTSAVSHILEDACNWRALMCHYCMQLVGLKAALYSKQQAAKREQANTVNRNESHTRKVSEKVNQLPCGNLYWYHLCFYNIMCL